MRATKAVQKILSNYEGETPGVKANLCRILMEGKLGGTGKMIILPVDQGIEHSAGASFAPNPIYFDPENIVKLAIEGGCNAVASTFGGLGVVSRKWAHKIPFIVKMNHNELVGWAGGAKHLAVVLFRHKSDHERSQVRMERLRQRLYDGIGDQEQWWRGYADQCAGHPRLNSK